MENRTIYRVLGNAVAMRRSHLGLTQAEVAQQVGLTRASIANIETGRQQIPVHHVYNLARALRLTSVYDLLPSQLPDQDLLPIDMTEVTPTQLEQVKDLIQRAVAHGRPGS